jgi:hypothetical protein
MSSKRMTEDLYLQIFTVIQVMLNAVQNKYKSKAWTN